jgi:2-haloacid dehalogenase
MGLARRNTVRQRPGAVQTARHADKARQNHSFRLRPLSIHGKPPLRACFNEFVSSAGIFKMALRPKYITFDCYGTLTRFRMGEMAREMFAGQVPAGRMDEFVADFSAFRFDEVLGDWKPYAQVLRNALHRSCGKWGVACTDAQGQQYYDAVPTWGPHADVPAGLSRIAGKIPLVILSNASNDQIHANVDKLGAPFHRVYTAQQAQAYKPRLRAFEYMLDELGCGPEDVLHVSSSLRYDLMAADDLGIRNKVFVNRGHGPGCAAYNYLEIPDIGGLPAVVGL